MATPFRSYNSPPIEHEGNPTQRSQITGNASFPDQTDRAVFHNWRPIKDPSREEWESGRWTEAQQRTTDVLGGPRDDTAMRSAAHALLGFAHGTPGNGARRYDDDNLESFDCEKCGQIDGRRASGFVKLIGRRGSGVGSGKDDDHVSQSRETLSHGFTRGRTEFDHGEWRQHASDPEHQFEPGPSSGLLGHRNDGTGYGDDLGQRDVRTWTEPTTPRTPQRGGIGSANIDDYAGTNLVQIDSNDRSNRRSSMASVNSAIQTALQDIERQLAILKRGSDVNHGKGPTVDASRGAECCGLTLDEFR